MWLFFKLLLSLLIHSGTRGGRILFSAGSWEVKFWAWTSVSSRSLHSSTIIKPSHSVLRRHEWAPGAECSSLSITKAFLSHFHSSVYSSCQNMTPPPPSDPLTALPPLITIQEQPFCVPIARPNWWRLQAAPSKRPMSSKSVRGWRWWS